MTADAMDEMIGTKLQQIWLDHLLAASLPLHKSGQWDWAGFALVHPGRNPNYARAMQEYRTYLKEPTSMRVSTLENLLAAGVLPSAAAFRARYLW